MITKNWILTCSILIYSVAFAQQKQIIANQETHIPIENVSIYFPESKTGISTNSDGQFNFSKEDLNRKVIISTLGYMSIFDNVSNLANNDTIFLFPQETELNEIVLSETFHKDQRDAIINIRTVKLNDNSVKGAYNLTNSLTQTPGIESKSTGSGISKPVIRGLSNNRLAVYIEGLRIENQQWGDDHSLGINANEVEQVEIVKGASSLMFGADAVGGVLLFKDPKFADKNTFELQYSPQYISNSNAFVNTLNTKISGSNFSLNLGISKSNFEDYSDGRNTTIHNSQFDNLNNTAILGYTKGHYSGKIKWSYLNETFGLLEHHEDHEDHEDEDHEGEEDIHEEEHHEFEPYLKSENFRLSTKHNLFYNKFNLNFDAGFSQNKLKEFEEVGSPAVSMNLNSINYTLSIKTKNENSKLNWIVGTQGNFKENKNKGTETLIPNSNENEIGIYALSHIDYNENTLFEIGLRYDRKNLKATINNSSVKKNFNNFNFSTGVNYNLGKYSKIRTSLSTGSRSPNTFELFTDGEHHGANRYEKGNENLEEEYAIQGDFSYIWQNKKWKIHLNPFFNHINNFIQINPSEHEIEGLIVYNFEQENSRLYGLDAEIKFQPNKKDQIILGISNVKGENSNGQALALMPSTRYNLQYEHRFNWKKNTIVWNFNPSFNSSQTNIRQFETATPNYFLVNTSISTKLNLNKTEINLLVGVENIFDKFYISHLSRYKTDGFGNTGRSIIVTMNIPLKYNL